jgi:hypothetical protein
MKKSAKLLDNFLKKMGLPYYCYFSNEFSADMSYELLFVNPTYWLPLSYQEKQLKYKKQAEIIKSVIQYYNNKYNIKVSIPTFCLFHEIGHLLSIDFYDKKKLEEELSLYQLELLIIDNKPISLYDKIVEYRQGHIEKIADELGYELYKKYEKQAKKFDKKIQKIIKKEYRE